MAFQKNQFESTEDVTLLLEPFVNPNLTGSAARIETGDTLTAVYTDPNGSNSSVTGGITFSRDSTTKIWKATISHASFYVQGVWEVRVSSNDSSSPDIQYGSFFWGQGATEDVNTIKSRLGSPVGATFSADIAEIEGETDSIISTLGTPAGASVSADIASIKTDTGTSIPADITTAQTNIQGTGSHTILDIYNRLGAPTGASLAADIQEIETETDSIIATLGTPAGASVSADIASIKTDTGTTIPADITTAQNNVLTRLGTPAGASVSADIASIYGRIGAPAGASIAADIASIKTDTGTTIPAAITAAQNAIQGTGAHSILDVYSRLGAPSGANIAADIAAIQTKLGSPAGASVSADILVLNTLLTTCRKILTNKWQIVSAQLIIFDDDNTTPFKTFNLFDDTYITPSSTRIFMRVPV